MAKLTLSPLQKGYSVEGGAETISVDFGGGGIRYRKVSEGASQKVSVNWLLDGEQYSYLTDFYFNTTKSGSIPFTIDLVVNGAERREHLAYFMPSSLRIDGIEGGNYNCSATLEVQQLKNDTEFDEAVIMLFDEYGSSSGDFITELDTFSNFKLSELS